MHRERGVHITRSWKRVLCATLVVGAVGCGTAAEEEPAPSEAQDSDNEAVVAPVAPAPPAEEVRLEEPAPVLAELPPAPEPKPEPEPRPEPEVRPSVPAQPSPPPQARSWFRRLGGPQDDTGGGLAVDGNAELAMVWLSTPREDRDREGVPGQRRALSVAKYGPDGEVRWSREFPRMRVASPRVGASPRGDVFLSGNAFLHAVDLGLGAANDGFLVKFSPDGQPLWQRRVGQKVYGLVADERGGALVAGEEWGPDSRIPVLAHYDAEGTFLWTRQLDRVVEGTELHTVALLPSGRAVVAGRLVGSLDVDGRTFGEADGQELVLLAFEPDGRLAWGQELRGVDGHVTGLEPGPDGGVTLVGQLRGELSWGGVTLTGPGAFVLSAGPDGAERWARLLSCGASPAAPVVAVDADGQVAVACGGVVSWYSPEGPQKDQRTLSAGECPEGSCEVASTALRFLPGQGLLLAGHQRHGGPRAGNAWDQDAFLRLLTP